MTVLLRRTSSGMEFCKQLGIAVVESSVAIEAGSADELASLLHNR